MPKLVDRTNQKFGKLTVVRRADRPGIVHWECLCECGNTTVVSATNLQQGNTTSCGCEWSRATTKDMIGRRFGKLVVARKLESKRFGKSVFAMYSCRCDCGGSIDVIGMSLRNGDTISCGCAYADAGARRIKPFDEKRNAQRAAVRRRYAKIRAATKPFDAELFDMVRTEAKSLRALREKLTGIKHDIDHVVPISSSIVCGLNSEFNLRVIPSRENRVKRNSYWPDMPGEAGCSR